MLAMRLARSLLALLALSFGWLGVLAEENDGEGFNPGDVGTRDYDDAP